MKAKIFYPQSKFGHDSNVNDFELSIQISYENLIECKFKYKKNAGSLGNPPHDSNVKGLNISFTNNQAISFARTLLNIAEGCATKDTLTFTTS